jgi:hypothetical protein
MEEIKQQATVTRAQLKKELESIYAEVKDNNPVSGLHGCFFVVGFSHLARLEQLVASCVNKDDELSDFFATDPNFLISDICKGIPAYVNAGEEQIGYAINLKQLNRIKDLAKAVPGELVTLAPEGVDPVVSKQQALVVRAQLKSDLESFCREIRGENFVEDVHFFGLYHVITYSQLARLEQLVDLYRNKSSELSQPLFSGDPGIVIAAIRTSIPAYEEGGKVQLGYAVRDSIVKALSDLAYEEAPQREVEPSLPAAADADVTAKFEQWYLEEINNLPSDLEKLASGVYAHESTYHYFKGFLGGLGLRNATDEATHAEVNQNVQPRLDALINQVGAQLESSRQVLGAKTSEAQG